MSAPAHRGPDFVHRRTRTTDILELFKARPGVWIDVHELAHVGGFASWRSRVSEARQIVVQAGDGSIEWNNNSLDSAYRFVPFIRLGDDPGQYREARLF